jgi:outer membrane protein TolC
VVKERFTKDEALDLLNQIKDKAKNSYLIYKKNIEATHKDKKTLKEKTDTTNNIDTIQQTQTTLNPTQGLTLKDAILLALDNSYKIKAAKEKVIQAKEKINEKLAAFYPKLDLYANGGGAYLKPYQAKEVKFWKSDESLVLSQNIYAGSKHINELKRERENLKVALAKYRDKVEEESLKIIDAYLSLVFQKKAIDKANENMKNLEKILSIVQTKANSGAASKGDLNYIKSQVDNAKTALVQVESKYKNALSYYEYFLGKVDKSKMPIESRVFFFILYYLNVFF